MGYEQFSRDELEQALDAMETRISELQQDHQKIKQRAKKVKADFENYKKRENDRKEQWQDQAVQDLSEDLVRVLDNLERAILSAEKDSNLLKGVKMVADQLYEELETRGLQRIDAEGEEFDPDLHNAVDTKEHDTHKQVIEEKRKGYMYNTTVLRPADVVVGTHANNNTTQSTEGDSS